MDAEPGHHDAIRRRSRRTWIGLGIFVTVVANCAWWSHAIPFDGAPDESDHADMLRFVADHGRLPQYGEDVFRVHLMNVMTHERYHAALDTTAMTILVQSGHKFALRQSYLFTPQLPYLLGGWFCRLLGGASVWRARLWSATCVGLAAVCTYAAGLAIAGPWPAAVAALCVGTWPQLTFIGAYVNDDAFAILAVSLLLLVCVRCETGRFDRRHALALGLALGIVGSVKPYVLAILPLVVLWCLRLARRSGPGFWRTAWPGLVLAGALTGFWLGRNTLLYDGDPTARRALGRHMREYVTTLPSNVAARTNLLFLDPKRGRFDFGRLFVPWTTTTFESFWARFGWMGIRERRTMYRTAFVVVIAALGVPWWRRWRQRRDGVAGGVDSFAVQLFAVPYLGLLLLGSLANSCWVDYQPQGRYLLSCVPGLCLQMSLGVAAGGTSRRRFWPALLLIFFVAQNLLARLLWLR